MSNQITAAMHKVASFLNLQPPLPFTATDQTTQEMNSIEERDAIEKEQARLNTKQAQISQEMEEYQSRNQKNNDSLEALLTERESIEEKVEVLYMRLYSSFHWILDDNEDDILQEAYHGSNAVYQQQCYQKCKLECRLADIDDAIERLDVEKSEICKKEEILLKQQLALDLEKETLDERKRPV